MDTRNRDIMHVLTANRPRPIDCNLPADPGPLWLDRCDREHCTALIPQPRRRVVPIPPDNRITITRDLRNWLRTHRRDAGLTLRDAASSVGHGEAWLSRIELGSRRSMHRDDYAALLRLIAPEQVAA